MKILFNIFTIFILLSSNLYAINSDRGVGIGREDKDRGSYKISFVGVYDQYLKEIKNEIENENYNYALESLQKYVHENPENPEGWNLIGLTSRKLKFFDKAEQYLQTGLEIDPDHVIILQYQGELYLETDRLDLAKANLAKLVDLCVFNCKEKNDLSKLIEEFEKN